MALKTRCAPIKRIIDTASLALPENQIARAGDKCLSLRAANWIEKPKSTQSNFVNVFAQTVQRNQLEQLQLCLIE